MIDTQDYSIYHVEKTRPSASAFIIFARHPYLNRHVVLKVLRNMRDERYDLSTTEKRHQCQIDALIWNPEFTSNMYLGLAPIRETLETLEELERKKQTLKEIGVGQVLDNPMEIARMKEEREYALLMHLLPDNHRLDLLLQADYSYKRNEPIPGYLHLLLKRISTIHTKHTRIPTFLPELEVNKWGSIEQLRKKLQENLAWLEKTLAQKPDLSDTHNRLYENLLPVLDRKKYQELFERRLKGNNIKRCHGDLKSDNIWIEADGLRCNERPETCVKILDCIDFKPLFCMIDTLSDIALLIVDIQARTGNLNLANAIIDEYLLISGEDEEAARYVLAYYLVEKAIIGTVNSFIDDKNEELGTRYNRVVHQRLDELLMTT